MSIFKTTGTNNNGNKKEVKRTKYSKLVNNLLAINNKFDNAVYTKIAGINADLSKILEEKDYEKIFSKSVFKVKLKKSANEKIAKKLDKLNNKEDVLSLAIENDIILTKNIKNLLKTDFSKGVELIKNKYVDDASFLKKWKTNIIKIKSVYQETNIWPLFISTFFMGFNNENIKIYAPLLLKEVEIIIENNNVILASRSSSIITNEKVYFLANEQWGVNFPIIDSEEEISLKQAIEEFLILSKNVFDNGSKDINFLEPFQNYSIKNSFPKILKPTLFPGLVLNLCAPLGGKLREVVMDLIEEEKMDDLIEIDVLKNYDQITWELLKKRVPLSRVAQTDISQELSILGALNHSSIIMGPPGTGKSQTIANILVNILAEGKRALFISQKKVALDVVLKRMGNLANLMLQFSYLEKQKTNEKAQFYKKIQTFIEYLKNYTQNQKKDIKGSSFLEEIELDFLSIKRKIGDINIEDSFILFASLVKTYNAKIAQKFNIEDFDNHTQNIFEILKNFKSKETFFEYWDNLELTKKDMAEKLEKIRTSIAFLKIYTYEKSFNIKYKLIQKIKEIPGYANFNSKNFQTIFTLKNYENFSILLEFFKKEHQYDNWVTKIKKSNNKTMEEEVNIIGGVVDKIKDKIKENSIKSKDYNKSYKALCGRIERSFTEPKLLMHLFKDIFKDMFNILVGTPEQLSTFVDFKKDHYDYVIFDEASQMFFEKAVPFISISDKIIVAGDNQQMQPSNWFSTRWEDDDLTNEESEIDSLLEWAQQQGLPSHQLEMNYRSASSELVLFSSKHFYKSKLKAIDHITKLEKTAFEVIDIKGEWKNSCNEVEAQKMLEIMQENIDKYESFILLTFNAKQQDLVLKYIIEKYPEIYNMVNSGKINVKNIENIQGEEADLVITSIGYDKNTKLSSVYVTTKSGNHALNVAITRAKNKMIVLKSLKSNEIIINNIDNENLIIFQKWLRYLELSPNEKRNYSIIQFKNKDVNYETYFKIKDNIKKWLMLEKFSKEIVIETDVSVGSYLVDFVIKNKSKDNIVFLIELDIFKNHNGFLQLIEERKKKDFLESKGYIVYRISENKWNIQKTNMKAEINNILRKYSENQ